jgi:hypothetical protein
VHRSTIARCAAGRDGVSKDLPAVLVNAVRRLDRAAFFDTLLKRQQIGLERVERRQAGGGASARPHVLSPSSFEVPSRVAQINASLRVGGHPRPPQDQPQPAAMSEAPFRGHELNARFADLRAGESPDLAGSTQAQEGGLERQRRPTDAGAGHEPESTSQLMVSRERDDARVAAAALVTTQPSVARIPLHFSLLRDCHRALDFVIGQVRYALEPHQD